MKPNNIKLTPNNLEDLEKTFLWQYREAIRTGEIIACHYLTKELDNLLEDLHNDEYYYDTKEAYKRITFMTTCLRQTKSPWYGVPVKLELFQLAFIEVLYSFYMVETDTRRFQEALFMLSRKNGKSFLCSALALTEMLIGNKGSDICCSSNNDNQARILTDEIDSMRQLIDPKQKLTWRNQQGIKCLYNNSRVRKISERTRNREGLSLDFIIADELHELREGDIIQQLRQSQSLKDNPLLLQISTEGFVAGGYLQNEIDRAKAIIDKEIDDISSKRYLPFIYEVDSENDVWQGNRENRLWQKANPLIGVAKKWDFLEKQVAQAQGSKTTRAFVLCKDFNLRISNATSWLKTEDFSYEYEPFDLEDFRGSLCLVTADLSQTTDLSAVSVILIKPNDNKKYIYTKYFIPEQKLNKNNNDASFGAKYEEWVKKGFIRVVGDNYIQTSELADYIFELYKKYGLRIYKVGYDSRFASEFINRLDEYSIEHEVVWQRPEVLSSGISMAEIDLQTQRIVGLNEVDKFCLSNATLKVDNRGFSILEKIKGQNQRKIDGAVCLVMDMVMYSRYRQVLDNN